MKFKGFVLAAIVVMALGPAAFPVENLVVKLFVTTVRQDSPVEIVGFKYPDSGPSYPDRDDNDFEGMCLTGGYCPKVVLRNTTGKAVTAVGVEGLYGNPAEPKDGSVEHLNREFQVLWVDNVRLKSLHVIAANGEAEFGSNTLWPFAAAGIGTHELGSSCVHVAIVVRRVEFSDGTVWMYDSNQNAALWRDSIPSGTAGSCQTSPEAIAKLKSLGGSWSGPAPTHSSNETIDSYSVICQVKKTGKGGPAVVCAW
jgi:hypothetical protein